MAAIKLDAKDKKILYQLDVNSRMSLTQIGKNVKMSKEAVHYRIKRLEKEKVILGYYTLVNPMILGYNYFRVGINYQNIDEETEERLINYLKEKNAVSWLGTHENVYDLVAVLIVKNVSELYEIVKNISYEFQENISRIEVTVGMNVYYFKSNLVHGMGDSSFLTLRGDILSDIKLDEKDINLLSHLSKDARITIVRLGELIGLSPKNVIARIRKLEDRGIIAGYLTNFNYQLLGFIYLKILLYLSKPSKELEKSIKSYLMTTPNLLYISDAIGLSDMEFEIILNSHNEMYDYINQLKKRFPNHIKDYKSMIIHKVHKIKYLGEMIT